MTIDKAVEILELENKTPGSVSFDDWETANKLGIEAIKHLQELRSSDLRWFDKLLPGETKD